MTLSQPKVKAAAAAVVALAFVSAPACTRAPRVLEPRPAPPREAPPIPIPPARAPEGHGRLVIYPTDGPMRVTARADMPFVPPGRNVAPTRSGDLCVAPCVVDLPYGQYRLFMVPQVPADGYEGGDVDDIEVGPGVNYLLRAPGKYESAKSFPPAPTALIVIGTGLFAVGSVLMPRRETDPVMGHTTTSVDLTGAVMVLGGLAVGTLGGILYYQESRAVSQEGSSTTWRTPGP